jgi:predicted O-methyltransferase YrrM
MAIDVAVVSAADANFFRLLRGMVNSLRDADLPIDCDLSLHVFDIGLTAEQRRWLTVQGVALYHLEDTLCADDLPRFERAFVAAGVGFYAPVSLFRCRIPELLPGHDVYMWIDADAWVQRPGAIAAFIDGALGSGFAIARETDPAYDGDTLLRINLPTFSLFGPQAVERLRTHGPLNAGIFAGRADAPHWQAWRALHHANIERTKDANLLFLQDQTTLCLVCHSDGADTALLPSTCNWVANHALPIVSDDARLLLRPLPPHEPLGIVHQAGHTKNGFFPLRRVSGGALSRTLGYQAHSQLAPDDYVSPGMQVILPDECFPNMVRGDQSASNWIYLRRGLPHGWLVDRRIPSWGFLNRDEVHILYNLALGFSGRPALEIGCLMGWSACHMALAGINLDVIDPLLANPTVRDSVQNSLKASRFPGRIMLLPGRSPEAVHQLAKERPDGWSLFFVDGDHEGDAPLRDVQACEPYAAPDAAMVFHDVASPFVAKGVAHLKAHGWRTRIYHTAQIMAVAWRGAVRPVAHHPDPRVEWQIPDHVLPLM